MSRKHAAASYRRKLAEIRPYVNVKGYGISSADKLTSAQRGIVSRYHNLLHGKRSASDGLLSQAAVVRPRSRASLETLKRQAGIRGAPGLRVVPFHILVNAAGERQAVKVRNGRAVISGLGREKVIIPFDLGRMVKEAGGIEPPKGLSTKERKAWKAEAKARAREAISRQIGVHAPAEDERLVFRAQYTKHTGPGFTTREDLEDFLISTAYDGRYSNRDGFLNHLVGVGVERFVDRDVIAAKLAAPFNVPLPPFRPATAPPGAPAPSAPPSPPASAGSPVRPSRPVKAPARTPVIVSRPKARKLTEVERLRAELARSKATIRRLRARVQTKRKGR